MSQWRWPLPVLLTKIQETPENWGKNFSVWNPKSNVREANHVMPILTPAFPAMNTTHSMHANHKKIINNEFTRGFNLLKNMNEKN